GELSPRASAPARFTAPDRLADDADLLIYPQGSFRLGTVVLPAPGADYDIDLVLRVAIAKEATTQAELKELAGQRLADFVNRTSGAPRLKEGGRCWTLLWPRFHVDILPSLPNPEDLPNGILLTDRDLRLWQLSNPIGYADWFQSRMREQFIQQRKILAADRSTTVDDVPQWEVKTTLQQAVQVLKRHRDLHFANQLDLKPPSILVTTLVGLAHGGHDDLFEAVVHIAPRLTQFVKDRNGVGWIANPALPEENFADRWRTHPARRRAFGRWASKSKLSKDLEDAAAQRGLDRVVARLEDGFGNGARIAEKDLGMTYRSGREAGVLASAGGSGLLVSAAGGTKAARVRNHNFYGRS
ncbi:MAG: nucleotidyltransferase, partial [bacterium]|nr:nucleotidyltransferase [bacterium]